MANITNRCVTCLSTDRRLVDPHELRYVLKEIQFTELNTSKGGICWECKSVIMKFYRFKVNALKALNALAQNIKLKSIKPFTSLGLKINLDYNHQYFYNFDPLNNCDIVPKTELDVIKEENDIIIDNNDTSLESDEEFTEVKDKVKSVYVATIKSTKETAKKKIDEREIEEKFMKVVFSEEEMIKNREDKRNHYNFKKIPFKCDSCVLGFTRGDTYKAHMEKKHDANIGPFACNVCNVHFATESALKNHRSKHYTCYRCRLCKFDTTELWAALNHCKMKHPRDEINSIHCGQCDEVFKSPDDLEQHIQITHTLHCNECGVRFKGKHTLRRHKARIHAIKREFICDICTKTFSNKTRLESHMVTHNSTIAKNLSYCNICKVQYKNIYIYRHHLKNSANHSERLYSCPECNKRFASKVYWTKHYKFYHLHKSQYKCDVCNKLFISDWSLKNHKQKHHGLSRPRDHTCNVCGKKFFTTSMLRNHLLTHSEQRSYMCEDCGDTFKQRPALYTHAKLVHGVARRK